MPAKNSDREIDAVMSKKRLLLFHPTIAPYRIDFFNDMYKAFQTRVCLQYENLKSQRFNYDKIKSQFIFSPTYLPRDSKLKLITAVKRELRSFSPDLVITCEFNYITIFTIIWRLFTGKKYKIVVMCDDSYGMLVGGDAFSRRHLIARNVFSKFIDEIILVDERVQQWYRHKLNIGLYFPIIKNDNKTREEYKMALPLSQTIIDSNHLEGKSIFLFVGRLVKLKNVDTLLKAFSFLDQTNNVLVVVGAGPEEESLKLLAKEKNVNAIFTGRLEGNDLNAWYIAAKCFVLASRQEAFGAVSNEALLAGCYALISNKAGSSCLIEEGVNGFTFDPNNTDDLVRKLIMINELPIVDVCNDGLRENQMRCSYFDMIGKLISDLEAM